jgi:hypothetical protein
VQYRTMFVVGLLLLAGIGCDQYEHRQMSFRAPVVVTRAGAPVPDRAVTFQAWKLKEGGGAVTGSYLTGDRFTNAYGSADFVFGYNLEYDNDGGVFMEGCRVVAAVDDSGAVYSDTALVNAPFQWPFGECQVETLRVELPPR